MNGREKERGRGKNPVPGLLAREWGQEREKRRESFCPTLPAAPRKEGTTEKKNNPATERYKISPTMSQSSRKGPLTGQTRQKRKKTAEDRKGCGKRVKMTWPGYKLRKNFKTQ